ncbi:MAG: 1-aminocyclopropane-1-carboxylate deaminase/D-cysteine desulfhydrase [Halioglobus sp.]
MLGVSMGCVSLLRLDLTGGLAPGNKHFKLQGNLSQARDSGLSRILSFGGAWSNHLHALAAVGYEQGFETVGIVRGEETSTPSAMLVDARDWEMRLVYVSRTEYRQRNEPEYLENLQSRFGPCLIVPEGGANRAGVEGCRDISALITADEKAIDRVVLPVGTGTTLAGLVLALPKTTEVLGISVLKGAENLDDNVRELLLSQDRGGSENWRIAHEFHCGGYAKVSPELREFMGEFERVHGVQLDPVYTGKMMFAIHRMIAEGDHGGQIVAVHTGGLQGRRGFSWLG